MTQEVPPAEMVLSAVQMTDWTARISLHYCTFTPQPGSWKSPSVMRWGKLINYLGGKKKKEKPIICEIEVGKNQLHFKWT